MRTLAFRLAVVLLSLCAASLSGCALEMLREGALAKWTGTSKSEHDLNIKTPDDRIKDLKKLAGKVKKLPAAEQQQTVEHLTKELHNENDPLVRRALLRTLAECPSLAATTVIIETLSDSDIETRRTACKCLGKRGGDESVKQLTRMVASDANVDVRLAAIRALGETHESAAMVPLAEAMADADPAMQARAHESLTAVSGRDFGNNVSAWREFAQNGKTDAPEISIAERLRRVFY